MISLEKASMLRSYIQRFVLLSDDEWNLLTPHLQEKKLKKGQAFIAEGKREKNIAFVIRGNLRQYYTRNGEEKTTYFYFENHLMSSYMSCLTGQPSKLTIEALIDCDLLVFSYETLLSLYKQSRQWERFGRLLAEYLAIGLEERMVGLLMLGPEERYQQLIESNKQKILERIPQHYIANYLGITPVSLSRIRNRIQKK
ncbi:Crp/Fnr family transcriptional regulator [Terrimonas alba]|uniref:Crp/Fnr family transcriptional regulator n=1 Tax=Terrimonas alba TaxID=3349636 RepID=UPI0035F2AE42